MQNAISENFEMNRFLSQETDFRDMLFYSEIFEVFKVCPFFPKKTILSRDKFLQVYKLCKFYRKGQVSWLVCRLQATGFRALKNLSIFIARASF